MTKIKFSTSQFLAALALAAAIGLMVQAINICPASALEASATSEQETVPGHVSSQEEMVAALADSAIATITVDADFTATSNFDITRDVTIDLGGHTITNAEETARIFNITKGTVTIKNGTLSATGASGITIRVAGSANASDSNYTVLTVEKGVTLQTPENDDLAYGIFIAHNEKHAYGVKIDFNGEITGGEGFQINGFIHDKGANIPEITIGNDAKITVSDMAVYASGYAKWNIGAATIVAGQSPAARATTISGTGIGAKAGEFTFNGTKISAYGTNEATSVTPNEMQGNGAVFQIQNNAAYEDRVNVTVNGGTYTSQNNAVFYQDGDAVKTLGSLVVNSGTFKAGAGMNVFNLSDGDDAPVKVVSGNFSAKVPTSYLEGEWVSEADGNGGVIIGQLKPAEGPVTTPDGSAQDEDKVEIPNTGAISRAFATNAVASVSLVVSMFVAAGIFYNRFKVYRRAAEYIPNPSVDRIKRK